VLGAPPSRGGVRVVGLSIDILRLRGVTINVSPEAQGVQERVLTFRPGCRAVVTNSLCVG